MCVCVREREVTLSVWVLLFNFKQSVIMNSKKFRIRIARGQAVVNVCFFV